MTNIITGTFFVTCLQALYTYGWKFRLQKNSKMVWFCAGSFSFFFANYRAYTNGGISPLTRSVSKRVCCGLKISRKISNYIFVTFFILIIYFFFFFALFFSMTNYRTFFFFFARVCNKLRT